MLRSRRRLLIILTAALAVSPAACRPSGGPVVERAHGTASGIVTVTPSPGTATASPGTSITFRGIGADSVEQGDIAVTGGASGKHTGTITAHADGKGFTFVPDQPFQGGENIRVDAQLPLRGTPDGTFMFRVAHPYIHQKSDEGESSASKSNEKGAREDGKAAKNTRTFATVPDLHPPQLDVLDKAGPKTSDGYVFLAPKKPAKENSQEGPMIANNQGDVVWFHPLEGKTATDFEVQKYRGNKVLTWWEGATASGTGQGSYVIMNDQYERIASVSAANGYHGTDLHEFLITPRGTALMLIYQSVWWNQPGTSGDKKQAVLDGVIQEVDIETGTVLWEWHSLGHIGVDESYGDPIGGKEPVFDYLHPNSISIDRDGNILFSGRHTNAVYKINRDSGEIMWRLGGKRSDFTMGEGTRFYYQHDAERGPRGNISLLDNGAALSEEDRKEDPPRNESRALLLDLNMETMKASLVRAYTHPDGVLAYSQANMQILPDGNVLIGWGSQPRYTEFSRSGEMVYDVRMPPDQESYRTFRFDWEGHPSSKPDIAVKAAAGGKVDVSASWNGASEVTTWQVLAGSSPTGLQPVKTARKKGFETTITVPGNAPYVAVRALDASGKKLASSRPIRTDR